MSVTSGGGWGTSTRERETSFVRSRYLDDGAADGASDDSEIIVDANMSPARTTRRRSSLPRAASPPHALPDDDDTSLPASRLMRALRSSSLEDGPLGTVCACSLDALGVRSHADALLQLTSWGMLDRFASPDFIACLGPARLKSKQLLRLAFATLSRPSDVVARIAALVDAGAVNAFSASAISALHAGVARWQGLESHVALVTALTGEMDTFAEVGRWMALYLNSSASALSVEEGGRVLDALLRSPHVRECAGDPADLRTHLTGYENVVEPVLAMLGAPEADEDERGNLSGFVAYSEDEEEEEAQLGDSSGSDSEMDEEELLETVRKSPAGVAAVVALAGKRRRESCTSGATEASEASSKVLSASRKRLRRSWVGDA